MTLLNIWQNTLYYLELTFKTELLWTIIPLAIATIVMLVYFEKYHEERAGWNTYTANSLILIFVAMILLRYIYSIDGAGSINFTIYQGKTAVSALIFLLGIVMLFLNFEHFLPEKIAMHLSSPLTLNLIAYIAILFIYTKPAINGSILIPLIIIFILLIAILNFLRIILRKFFKRLRRMKEKEKVEEIIQEKKPIKEEKKKIKKEEKIIRKEKKDIKKEELKLAKIRLKKLDKQKKEAIKLKKVVKNE